MKKIPTQNTANIDFISKADRVYIGA